MIDAAVQSQSGGPLTGEGGAALPERKTRTGVKRAYMRRGAKKVWAAMNGGGSDVAESYGDVVPYDGGDGGSPIPAYGTAPVADAGVLQGRVIESVNGPVGGGIGEGAGVATKGLNGGAFQDDDANGGNGEKKKRKHKYHIAVNPPKQHGVMRINGPTASFKPSEYFRQSLSRRALLRDAELTPRDLRRIDPYLLQTNNTPALLVSDQTIIVNLGVRVIVRPDHALLFEPDTATAQRFLESLKTRGETKDTPGGVGGAPIPFELEVVEAALQETTSQLYAKLEFCEARCRHVSESLRTSINPVVLEELRLTKQSLVELDSRAGAIRQVLLDTLDDDDDITDFTISSTAELMTEEKEDEEEEVENLIEYYLQQTETVHSAAEQLLENTRDLEESISVSLSSRRYEVSKLELTLSIATFAAACGALITGVFGMNLRSCLEMSITAFYLTCFLIVSGMGWIFRSIMKFAQRQKIL
ncbi:CorA metal ion transporter family [Micromonas pusilla CCMP1545]|uniref:Magnesium transporter n=1 Tax=Micromonas pusilla (strain CCMP1545) TaxID=564608 RepID=C1MSU1_MICPC|nr:CorA metal ion transporter family [Micromonas pusilla CCMP1545]EEH57193.1 CorA metal ion transporter family [Micromonas pusilla CCMP1545]|eukprot:XP_003058738.1 CorA metal ion transporter family [Micromonas pusilla CCMP1545]